MIQQAPWFEESRLGMLCTGGLYALPARHEWVMNAIRNPWRSTPNCSTDFSEVILKVTHHGAGAQYTRPGSQPAGTLTVKLPVQRPDVAVPVLELFLKSEA